MIPLFLTIGAGIGLMSISVLIADFTLLHCTKKKKFYQKIKEITPAEDENEETETVRLWQNAKSILYLISCLHSLFG